MLWDDLSEHDCGTADSECEAAGSAGSYIFTYRWRLLCFQHREYIQLLFGYKRIIICLLQPAFLLYIHIMHYVYINHIYLSIYISYISIDIYIIYIYLDMKSSFPERFPENELEMPMPSLKIMLRCIVFFYICICAYICIYLWRALIQNMISELGIGIATSIWRLALNPFLEKSSSYVHTSVDLWV